MDHSELGRAESRPEEHGRQDGIRQVVRYKLPGEDVGELLRELLDTAGEWSLHVAQLPQPILQRRPPWVLVQRREPLPQAHEEGRVLRVLTRREGRLQCGGQRVVDLALAGRNLRSQAIDHLDGGAERFEAAQEVVSQHLERRAEVGGLLRREDGPDLLDLEAHAAQPPDPDEGREVGRSVEAISAVRARRFRHQACGLVEPDGASVVAARVASCPIRQRGFSRSRGPMF